MRLSLTYIFRTRLDFCRNCYIRGSKQFWIARTYKFYIASTRLTISISSRLTIRERAEMIFS